MLYVRGSCNGAWCRVGGNGGVSIRKRSVMESIQTEIRCDLDQCQQFDLFHQPASNRYIDTVEDTVISIQLDRHRKRLFGHLIPSPQQMQEFSAENLVLPSANPFFFHKAWLYQEKHVWLPKLARVKRFYDNTHN